MPWVSAIRLAVRAVARPHRRKSAKAVTGEVLAGLLATCSSDSLRDVRDRASGGRRHSEVAGLRKEQLTIEAPVRGEDGSPCPLFPPTSATPRILAPAKMKSLI